MVKWSTVSVLATEELAGCGGRELRAAPHNHGQKPEEMTQRLALHLRETQVLLKGE